MTRRPFIAAAAGIAITLTGAAAASAMAAPPTAATQHAGATPTAKATGQPNVILIKTDDQIYDDPAKMATYMPRLMAFMQQRGVTYKYSYVSTPSCCQSRAATFVGRYDHNTGVTSQGLGNVLDTRGSIAGYLQRSGYRTALFGKYLNLIKRPPLFNEYTTIVGGGAGPGTPKWYYNFVATFTNGTSKKIYGDPKTGLNYNTTWIGKQATNYLDRALANPATPFYLEFDPTAPHTHDANLAYTMVQPKYRSLAVPGCVKPPVEEDRTDKPAFVQANFAGDFGWKTICPTAQRALKSVDDWFCTVVTKLTNAGVLDNTVIIFTSDNGLLNGEHRLTKKFVAYEPSIRVPLMISFPGVFAPGTPADLNSQTAKVMNIDILPTILDLVGLTPDPALPAIDGRSLVTTPTGHGKILSEYWFDRWTSAKPAPYPTWASLYDGQYKFIVTYSDTPGTTPVTQELYDTIADPDELTNLIPLAYGTGSPTHDVAAWAQALETERTCAGTTCS